MDSGTLRRAAVFHAVAVAGGITAAGRVLGKSASAVHADLRRFERDLGLTLTQRIGRSIKLTARGRSVFNAVDRALAELDSACTLTDERAPNAPALDIGSVSAFGRYRLMPRLLEKIPAAQRIVLTIQTHDNLLAALCKGEMSMALTYRPVIAAPLMTIQVATESLVLVGADGPAEFEDAVHGWLPMVTYDEYEYVFGCWYSAAVGKNPPIVRRHDHFTELEDALASVAAGRGATIAPKDACEAMGLKATGPQCSNDIYLCGTQAALESAVAQTVIGALRDD